MNWEKYHPLTRVAVEELWTTASVEDAADRVSKWLYAARGVGPFSAPLPEASSSAASVAISRHAVIDAGLFYLNQRGIATWRPAEEHILLEINWEAQDDWGV